MKELGKELPKGTPTIEDKAALRAVATRMKGQAFPNGSNYLQEQMVPGDHGRFKVGSVIYGHGYPVDDTETGIGFTVPLGMKGRGKGANLGVHFNSQNIYYGFFEPE